MNLREKLSYFFNRIEVKGNADINLVIIALAIVYLAECILLANSGKKEK